MGVKISQLPPIDIPALSDVFPVVQAGVTYKETITQLSTLLGSMFDSSINVQVFTTSGMYVPTTGLKYFIAFAIGGGGAGGGASGAAGQMAYGTCGGAGSLSILYGVAATVGAGQTVTIGAGGTGVSNSDGNDGSDSSLGSLCIGKGGSGGFVGVSTATLSNIIGGDGGVAGTGSITSVGNQGGGSVITSGSGGQAYVAPTSGTFLGGALVFGNAPPNTGAGGSGKSSFNAGGAVAGFTGSSGIVWVVEFL